MAIAIATMGPNSLDHGLGTREELRSGSHAEHQHHYGAYTLRDGASAFIELSRMPIEIEISTLPIEP